MELAKTRTPLTEPARERCFFVPAHRSVAFAVTPPDKTQFLTAPEGAVLFSLPNNRSIEDAAQ
jgi:hypothetical protein